MHYVFITLLAALLVKDILPLGDRYVLRGVSEGIALAVGAGWLITHQFHRFAKRYVLILSYLATLVLTAFVSQRPFFVILQVMSLASVTLFFIAYVESSALDRDIFRWNLLTVGCAFLLVCMGSLVLLAVRPQLAFEVTPEGNRFRGLFNEPAMMGAVSGLLVGLAAFGRLSWLIRISGALAAIPCLYLTGTRTSWGAAAAGLLITGIIYIRQKRAWMIALAFVGVIGSLGLVIVDVHLASETQSKVIRSGSIGTLSGRTVLWELALKKYQDSPFLGYGFTTGSDALASDMGDTLSTAFGVADRSQQKAFSLHSGYIQSFLDSGAIGASLYLSILGLALWRLLWYDQERRHGAEMYCLLFFSISNLTDTIIFGAAVFYEVFYWYLSVVALSVIGFAYEASAESLSQVRDEQGALPSCQPDLVLKADSQSIPSSARRYPLLQD
jgi:exopolysaccharide production protein ExoQ